MTRLAVNRCRLPWLALVLATSTSAAKPVRITYVYSDGNMPGTMRVYKALLAERPDLRGQLALQFLTESVFDDVKAADLTSSDVVVFDVMNQQMLDRYNEKNKIDLVGAVVRRGKVLGVGTGLMPRERYAAEGVLWDERARAYWEGGGFSNQMGLLKYAASLAGIKGLDLPPPQAALDFGYYYPGSAGGHVFTTWDQFEAWRKTNGKANPGAPRIAIGFYKANYYTGDTELLDAVIAEVERQGAEAIPVFGYPGALTFQKLLVDSEGHARADAALGFFFNFADFDESRRLDSVDISIINMVSLYGRSEKEWRAAPEGVSAISNTFEIAVPEVAGTTAPTVVGSKEKIQDKDSGLTIVVSRPIASRVKIAVERGLRYAELKRKANRDKRVALLFYDFPPGKANIGASYLNVTESLSQILNRLRAEGYDTGAGDFSTEAILKDLMAKARNVAGYAPGELDALVAQGSAVRVPIEQYQRWLDALAPSLRAKILKDWGAPSNARIMASGGSFIIPVIRYGNIALMPQPARGWGEDPDKLYHAKNLAPPHQYVAGYAWLRNEFKADAVVHLGTHGTLEWLDGKDIGLSEEDAPDALIADMPDIYIYNVDVVGEGLVAKRRGMATLVDHMVPPFRKGGLYPELAALNETVNDIDVNEEKNPELAKTYAENAREQILKLGIAKDLNLDLSTPGSLNEEVIHRIENYLIELKSQNIPYGLHTFGKVPAKDQRESTIDAIVSADRSQLPNQAKVLASKMEERITASGPAEMDRLMRALRGGFVPTGGGGEPIRNPDSYPTGRNLYGVDPDKVPKPAAWAMGVKLADQMLAEHLKKHGRYPEKVSFVIWGDETMRHEGVMESQIFYLMGTKPVWDERGKVVDVEVIPASELKRPRVDIVIASAAAGMFSNVTMLMDRAVQKVKAIEEADNLVRQHYLKTKTALLAKGYSEKDADQRAGVRIFDEPPGTYNLNTSTIVAASGTWDSDKGMADDYIRKLGHGYGNGFWGEAMEDVFRMALSGTDKVVHSSSTMLYGALDNDDMFMYVGGLANAIKNVDGKTPEVMITNSRDPGKPEMTSMDKFLGNEFRSRYVNPTWIEGMKKEGYAGAGEMRSFVEYLWGWNATVTGLVDDKMWKETFEVYVQDKDKLGMKEFFEKNSPFAYQDMTARMVETVRKGYWKADAETEKKLLEEYIESVNRHGVGCAEHTCGNPRLSKYVMERAKAVGIPVPAIEGFRRAMEKAIGTQISTASAAAEKFVSRNERQKEGAAPVTSKAPVPVSQAPSPKQLQGYLMEMKEQAQRATARTNKTSPRSNDLNSLWVSAPVLLSLLLWRQYRHSAESPHR